MSRRRKILAGVCLVLVPGSISVTLGYALYLRSSGYRESLAEGLSEYLGMFVTLGGVRPLSAGTKAFDDVRVYLEEDGREVFSSDQVVWRSASGKREATYTLELTDGWLLVGSGAWTESDYRRMLAGGLGHDFTELNLEQVRLKRIDLRFTHPPLEFRADETSGVVLFNDDGSGQASLDCRELNRVKVAEPINIALRFIPGAHLQLQEVRLSVPSIPVNALGIDELLRQTVSSGRFDGAVSYRETPDGRVLSATGSLMGARLKEFTGQLPGGPFHGVIDIELDEAVILDRRLRRLDAHGHISDLRLSQIMPRLAGASGDSPLAVRINQVRWMDDGLAYLSAAASGAELSLEALSGLWGRGTITGTAKPELRSLLIVDDRLRFAELEITAEPPPDAPGLIDRTLIAEVARQWLGVDLTTALPEELEYTQLGVRLVLDNGELEVLGTHGPDRETILTVKMFGRTWPIVQQPNRTYTVPDLITLFRDSAEDVDLEQVHSWWEWLQTAGDGPQPAPNGPG